MKDILFDIIANKKTELEEQKKMLSPSQLIRAMEGVHFPTLSMKKSLLELPGGIISEFKRRSPSKGFLKQDAIPEEIIPAYEKAGAAAVSILTDEKYFGGTLKDIKAVRSLINIPILRKDFIIDEYQLYQAKVVGANAVLLIAACLTVEQCKVLAAKARQIGLEVLLEIHSEEELEYIGSHIDMVGVNNRNLGTFHTDVANSFKLVEKLPPDTVLVSESGISDIATIQRLQQAGFKGFLIGESFMVKDNPGKELETYITTLLSGL